MPIIGKDISLLTQKAAVAGTEKIQVSDSNFITPGQIVAGVFGTEIDISNLTSSRRYITNSGVWRQTSSTVAYCVMLPVTAGKTLFVKATASYGTSVAFMTSESFGSNGSAAAFAGDATGPTAIAEGASLVMTAPTGTVALYILTTDNDGNECAPTVYDADGTIMAMIGDIETLLSEI